MFQHMSGSFYLEWTIKCVLILETDRNIECPINFELIKLKDEYCRCKQCKFNFSKEALMNVFKTKFICPICRADWTDKTIYYNSIYFPTVRFSSKFDVDFPHESEDAEGEDSPSDNTEDEDFEGMPELVEVFDRLYNENNRVAHDDDEYSGLDFEKFLNDTEGEKFKSVRKTI